MDWVQEKIQQARTKRWKQLDLGNAGLREIPLEVFDLDALESLVLGLAYYDYDRNEVVVSENQGAANQITVIPGEITRLINLTMLNLYGTQVNDLSPLQGLRSLASLNLIFTQVSDLSPLQGLHSLASLNLIFTQVSDLSPLQGLHTLASLNLGGTQVSDLSPLQGLHTLASLNLYCTQVSNLSPLQSLHTLASLNLSGTQVSDLSPLQGLHSLASLDLGGTQVSDLSPLQGLHSLASLNLGGTQVSDLSPLQGLHSLASLDLSGTPIHTFPDFVLALPHLHSLVLYGSPIRDVPPEILSSQVGENCLDAVRSHFADKTHGIALDREIKLILLGNGRVGKTSLVKRLVHNDFDPCEPSTHGIQLVPWNLSDHEEVLRMNIWDFGGQDIYHGTHTLFLRSRAIFLLVWDRDSAQQPGYDADGFHFEHFPLSYWLDYIRDATPDSPVIVVENKCDDSMGTLPAVPIPGTQVYFSAKTGYGRDTLTTLIREACQRELTNAGARAIGVGRWQVKQTLLGYMADDVTHAPVDRRYRTLSYAHFHQLCAAQQGRVTSAYELLRYLHNTGVVYYQKDLFRNQIILDQRWAIEAIYAILHRQHALHWLKRVGGRFRRSDLQELVWSDRSEAEQRLFLSFMESCALCFCLSDRNENDPEYIAPELLPDQATYAEEVALRRHERGAETIWYTYTQRFIHRSVMQRLMVRVGQMFRTRAVYWQGGVCIDVPGTQSMAIVDCERGIGGNPAQGRMTIEVRGRARHELLNRIRNECERLIPHHQELWQAVSVDGTEWVDVAKLPDARLLGSVVSEQRHKLDAQPFLFLLSKEPHDDLSPTAPFPGEEHPMPSAKGTIYLSYAWGDAQESGASREDIVDRLYASLIADGYTVKRDKMDLSYKGLISEFMSELGQGDCIVVVISDKYLKSPFCMGELLAIYKNQAFYDRICPIVLTDAKIWTLAECLAYVKYWAEEESRLEQRIKGLPLRVLSTQGTWRQYEKHTEITEHYDKLIYFLADINSQTPQQIEANDFETLKRTIDARLQQLQ